MTIQGATGRWNGRRVLDYSPTLAKGADAEEGLQGLIDDQEKRRQGRRGP